jgi:hypothetical protein
MGDRDKTELLTKIGFLYLKQMGCYAIGTEIHLLHRQYDLENRLDHHFIIDLLGIEYEYLPNPPHDILRGVEVKVSRSDYKKGFIHHGCTFNYILAPKGLIQISELEKTVGLIEVDPNFKIISCSSPIHSYALSGVFVTKNARREEINQDNIMRCKGQIAESLTNQVKRWLISELPTEVI